MRFNVSVLVSIILLLSFPCIVSAVTNYNYTYGNETIVILNGTPGDYNFTAPRTGVSSFWILAVAGGGGSGRTDPTNYVSAGSGAGGVVNTTITIPPGSYLNIHVGKGGYGGNASSYDLGGKGDSTIVSNATTTFITAVGGGSGATKSYSANTGGSGGGGIAVSGRYYAAGGTSGQGYIGGDADVYGSTGTAAGGGGGAGAAGSHSASGTAGGNGGNGFQSLITGVSTYYGGGGGGAGSTAAGTGGSGGGGAGSTSGTGTSGTANTGGGAGGSYAAGASANGAEGGSGIVIIRYNNIPLTANFNSNITSGNDGSCIQFTDTSTGAPTAWSWLFGDGGNSTEQNPVYCYSTVGSYNVALNVSREV